MGILDGKRILVAGVTMDTSIGFAVARVAQEQGAHGRGVELRPRAGHHPADRRPAPEAGAGHRARRHRPRAPRAAPGRCCASTWTASTAWCTPSPTATPRPCSAATSSRPVGGRGPGGPGLGVLPDVADRRLPAADGPRRRRRRPDLRRRRSRGRRTTGWAWPRPGWSRCSRYLARDLGPAGHPGQPGVRRPAARRWRPRRSPASRTSSRRGRTARRWAGTSPTTSRPRGPWWRCSATSSRRRRRDRARRRRLPRDGALSGGLDEGIAEVDAPALVDAACQGASSYARAPTPRAGSSDRGPRARPPLPAGSWPRPAAAARPRAGLLCRRAPRRPGPTCWSRSVATRRSTSTWRPVRSGARRRARGGARGARVDAGTVMFVGHNPTVRLAGVPPRRRTRPTPMPPRRSMGSPPRLWRSSR